MALYLNGSLNMDIIMKCSNNNVQNVNTHTRQSAVFVSSTVRLVIQRAHQDEK